MSIHETQENLIFNYLLPFLHVALFQHTSEPEKKRRKEIQFSLFYSITNLIAFLAHIRRNKMSMIRLETCKNDKINICTS